MIERVRAILITPAGTMLTIKRTKPGMDSYWVLPGGHVSGDDMGLEAALAREIREELAADIESPVLVHVLEHETERQYFYLAHISNWSFADRTGPEFREPGRGQYDLEEIPLTFDAVASLNLKPDAICTFLATALQASDGLSGLPDLSQVLPR